MNYKLFYCLTAIIVFFTTHYNSVLAENINLATIRDLLPLSKELKIAFEKETPFINVNFITGKERELIEQIQLPDSTIDIILLDSKKTIDKLGENNFIAKDSIKSHAKDKLCVVVKKSVLMRPYMLYPRTIVMKAIAVCNPEFTALGRYTEEALMKLDRWKKADLKIVLFDTEEIVSNTVSKGHYDGGIIYCSTAEIDKVNITDTLNPDVYSPIIYASGVNIKNEKDSAAYKFSNFLSSPAGKEIFKKFNLVYK